MDVSGADASSVVVFKRVYLRHCWLVAKEPQDFVAVPNKLGLAHSRVAAGIASCCLPVAAVAVGMGRLAAVAAAPLGQSAPVAGRRGKCTCIGGMRVATAVSAIRKRA